MLVKEAKQIIGSLGNPSKMPGMSYGLPAGKASWFPEFAKKLNLPIPPKYGCSMGGKFVSNPKTPCYKCYANERGNYTYNDLKHGQLLRLNGTYHPLWAEAMIFMIDRYIDPADPYFRWLDSGDIPHMKFLWDILEIAKALPHVNFWLPTQERVKLLELVGREIPDNLCIRVSNSLVDNHKNNYDCWDEVTSSSVSTTGDHTCPSEQFDNTCGDCRMCWDRQNEHTIYKIH